MPDAPLPGAPGASPGTPNAVVPGIPEQQPTNTPASGAYGEGAALDGLKKSLPAGAVGTGTPPATPPGLGPPPTPGVFATPQDGPTGRPNTGAAGPPGVPSALLAPTSQPDTPVATPLDQGQTGSTPQAQTAAQGRIMILDQLRNSPDVSAQTREWAMHVLVALTGGAPGPSLGG